jgi:hypothetical protein
MQAWRPRRPARQLEQDIFGGEHHVPAAKWLWGGLVPAAACALLTLMTINHNDDLPGRHPLFGLKATGLTAGLAAADEQMSAQNHLAVVTFDSTNHSIFNSNGCFTPKNNFSNE